MASEKFVVVGAGPVGSLAALYAASRGFDVEVYELRGDLRDTDTAPLNFTKSINLALSERGINALRSSGHPALLDEVVQHTLPMYGRMIHTRNTAGRLTEESQQYDVHGRVQLSVDRAELNKLILNWIGAMPNVKLYFHHKLTGADFKNKKAWFEIQPNGSRSSGRAPEIEVSFDFMIGADGAHSAVRHHMMKYARMQYEQIYIDCLWCEFTMSASKSGGFRISPNHLHIWPGGSFMFIALPNVEKSFTCTLFAPVAVIEQLEGASDGEIVSFFDSKFPGVSSHIPSEELVTQFRRNPHLPLINIKCSPHHFRDSVVILGDAANAMVPFYGQGMNAGLESVRVLFGELDSWTQGRLSREAALVRYGSGRIRNLHAVADLSLANYVEMRSSVTSWTYKLRKYIEESLDKYLPQLRWSTQYARVSFSNTPYADPQLSAGVDNNKNNQAAGAGAVFQGPPRRPAIYETTAVLPDNVAVSLTKGRTLIDALGRASVPMSSSTTLLVITLKLDPELLPTSHHDFGKEGLKPRVTTMFVDYISIERIKAIVDAKARSVQGGNEAQPRRLCYKCLAYDAISTDSTRRTIDLTVWNRNNLLRHVMEWHPLRMIMHATVPVELTWHKSCLDEPGKTLNKVRENWIDSTPGSLFRILSAELGIALTASADTTRIKLFGVLPPPATTANKDRAFDYVGFVTKLWDAGEELGGVHLAASKEARAKNVGKGYHTRANDNNMD
ncbi:hypothetical protein DV736_g3680, partial [Chaetothyriales sp. CBS 134916]